VRLYDFVPSRTSKNCIFKHHPIHYYKSGCFIDDFDKVDNEIKQYQIPRGLIMPSFSEIEKENNPISTVISYTKKLHEITGRNVIIYSSSFLTQDTEETSIDDYDKNGFMNVIKDLDKSKGLDLILHTPGGSVAATESIIDYLHSVFGDNIRSIIPQISMSGGTMIACSCKEILMGKHSSLGPVDPQVSDLAAKDIIEEFELAKKETATHPKLIPFWEILLDKYPENILIECEKAIKWSEYILEKSLKYSMFKENNEKEINQIKNELITSETTKNHSQNLSAKKCQEIGLKIKYLEDDENLQDIVLSIHHAYLSYFNHKPQYKLFVNQNGEYYAIGTAE
ncbi:MAG: hypothetical protein UHW60_05440, partial [Methanobrevibacter sp.]|nr:hypothetical protein [Methanobrevibacter sp.]